MNLFGLMDTSGGAMQAERMRAEVVAANMANAETTRTASGGPYRRQQVVFAANRGDPGFLDSISTATASATASGLSGALAKAALPTLSLPGLATTAPGVHIA
jgi:flagellar basal-body rod protein FlgC